MGLLEPRFGDIGRKKKMTLTEQGNEYGDFDTIWNFFCYSRIIPNILYVDSIFITY